MIRCRKLFRRLMAYYERTSSGGRISISREAEATGRRAASRETSMSNQAPKGIRLRIGLFGRTNVGKSSLLNAITQQNVAIVSAEPGTTTDPVEKAMELLPLGPVLFIDTGGIDDQGALGAQRVARTIK